MRPLVESLMSSLLRSLVPPPRPATHVELQLVAVVLKQPGYAELWHGVAIA